MALDTRNKRAAAIGMGLASLRVLPAPDNVVATADRRQLAFCYPGLGTGATVLTSLMGMAMAFFTRRRRDDR